jgi:hypothetical protein
MEELDADPSRRGAFKDADDILNLQQERAVTNAISGQPVTLIQVRRDLCGTLGDGAEAGCVTCVTLGGVSYDRWCAL